MMILVGFVGFIVLLLTWILMEKWANQSTKRTSPNYGDLVFAHRLNNTTFVAGVLTALLSIGFAISVMIEAFESIEIVPNAQGNLPMASTISACLNMSGLIIFILAFVLWLRNRKTLKKNTM